ncbi:MAG: hypothetical protein HY914_20405 [Desulfomonile tiedjei]|nr:hypothetical protein [Desulfomonile tiedjei]
MEYMHIAGHVYSRNALTPPVINSDIALKFGIQVACNVAPGQYAGPNVGSNVKLRLLVDGGTRRMTCHAKVDWVREDPDAEECLVGFGSLSLTDEEFWILERNFSDRPRQPLEFGTSVRDKATAAETVRVSSQAREIMRLKAVNFPVSIIEAIDESRGPVSFSEFVTNAVRAYLKRPQADS